jgi:hypothetical protein
MAKQNVNESSNASSRLLFRFLADMCCFQFRNEDQCCSRIVVHFEKRIVSGPAFRHAGSTPFETGFSRWAVVSLSG